MPDQSPPGFITPDWPSPRNVRALTTLRTGGVSQGAYQSFNLAVHTEDDPVRVEQNRQLLKRYHHLPRNPMWLSQVHSDHVICIDDIPAEAETPVADGAWSKQPGHVCAVMTADCLPVLLCNKQGTRVAAVHAGWRGLASGIVTEGVRVMQEPAEQLLVWLGPAIGPTAFEVGSDVVQAFTDKDARNVKAFKQVDNSHWLCNIYHLARNELNALGLTAIYGGDLCTYEEAERFYSFRRDGKTGRMASLIWFE
jgi:YfiH family protein